MKRGFYIFLFGFVLCNTGCIKHFYYTATNKQANNLFNGLAYSPKHTYMPYNNDKIHVVSIGDSSKPMLVIVHGAPGEWYNSFPGFLNDSLLQQYYIVTYDRPGYGSSSISPYLASITYQTNVLEQLIVAKKYNEKKITLLARSYGTPIACNYAASHSSLINKLILIGSTTAPKLERIFWFSYLGKLSLSNLLIPKALNSATVEKFNHKKELQAIAPTYKNITCNTYVLHGDKDWMADKKNLDYNLDFFENADVIGIKIKDGPHNILGKHPEIIKSILLDSNFLKRNYK